MSVQFLSIQASIVLLCPCATAHDKDNDHNRSDGADVVGRRRCWGSVNDDSNAAMAAKTTPWRTEERQKAPAAGNTRKAMRCADVW